MSSDNPTITRATPEDGALPALNKSKFDLVVLRYMLQKVLLTARAQTEDVEGPQRSSLEERRGRVHRMILLTPRDLLAESCLAFVGFVSGRRQALDQRIIDELFRVDQHMLGEIIHIPGLLSYSSLELHAGNWYNLVILRDARVKQYFDTMQTHRYAAHHLSLDYYEWIRLHNGILPGGLIQQDMVLRSTRHYHFPGMHQPPTVRELVYEAEACALASSEGDFPWKRKYRI